MKKPIWKAVVILLISDTAKAVRVGVKNDTVVAITDGLHEGEEVLLPQAKES